MINFIQLAATAVFFISLIVMPGPKEPDYRIINAICYLSGALLFLTGIARIIIGI